MGQKNVNKDMWTNGRASSMVIRDNEGLSVLYRGLDTVADIKKKRLEYIEHVERMDQGRAFEKIFESKPEESRSRRPRFR
jgi:hypothetical protein